jgi:hypothetical protein
MRLAPRGVWRVSHGLYESAIQSRGSFLTTKAWFDASFPNSMFTASVPVGAFNIAGTRVIWEEVS